MVKAADYGAQGALQMQRPTPRHYLINGADLFAAPFALFHIHP
jgi:hypothetical protein